MITVWGVAPDKVWGCDGFVIMFHIFPDERLRRFEMSVDRLLCLDTVGAVLHTMLGSKSGPGG